MNTRGLEQQETQTAARLTGRTLRRLGVLVPVLVLFSVAPAFGHEDLTLTHEAPPAAIDGTDVELVVVVRTEHADGVIMSRRGPITVTAHYRIDEGTRSVSAELGSSGGAARLTIPGRDVRPPMLRYWITANQRQCSGAWSCYPSCDEVEARAPNKGIYAVPVHSPRSDQVERPQGRRGPYEIAKDMREQTSQVVERLMDVVATDETPYVPGRGFGTLDEEPFEVPETSWHAPALHMPSSFRTNVTNVTFRASPR